MSQAPVKRHERCRAARGAGWSKGKGAASSTRHRVAATPCRRRCRRRCQLFHLTTAGDAVVDDNIAEYCSLDKNAKRPQRELTLGEKEQLFLEATMVRGAGTTSVLCSALRTAAAAAEEHGSARRQQLCSQQPCAPNRCRLGSCLCLPT